MYSRYSPTSSNSSDDGHSRVSSLSSSHQFSQLIGDNNKKLCPEKHQLFNHCYCSHQTPSMTHTPTVGITPATSHKINSSSVSSIQKCLRFKYFSTFFICVASLTLLTASLATQKWLVSKPIRIVRLLSQAQQAPLPPNNNLTTFTAHQSIPTDGVQSDQQQQHQYRTPWTVAGSQLDQTTTTARNSGLQHLNNPSLSSVDDSMVAISHSIGDSNELTSKFQGRVYFGLFTGLKVLNYGFGDRVSQLTVAHLFISNLDDAKPVSLPPTRHELINFKSWVITLSGVLLAMLFALIGSIFAIINFVIVPRGTVTGPVGLVTWNLAACASCTLSIFTWLVEYFIKLKWSVLSADEVQNGWTSENRSQFGYSYYFVVIAFMLHLVNVVIVSVVQSETWTSNSKKEAKRQASSVCDGVIMLY